MADGTLNPKALLRYDVFATPDLTASGGFLSLTPPRGFLGAGSGPHFFKVRCLFCGEETDNNKDVAVYALARGTEGCTERFGPRLLTKSCRPTCPNAAHLVRKCANPDCRKLGSIELVEVARSLTQTGPVHFLTAKTLGYQVISYNAGQKWEAVSETGEAVFVLFGDDVFNGSDAAGGNIAIPTTFNVISYSG